MNSIFVDAKDAEEDKTEEGDEEEGVEDNPGAANVVVADVHQEEGATADYPLAEGDEDEDEGEEGDEDDKRALPRTPQDHGGQRSNDLFMVT